MNKKQNNNPSKAIKLRVKAQQKEKTFAEQFQEHGNRIFEDCERDPILTAVRMQQCLGKGLENADARTRAEFHLELVMKDGCESTLRLMKGQEVLWSH